MRLTKSILTSLLTTLPVAVLAAEQGAAVTVNTSARDAGISGLWVLANISYAGMRAQKHPGVGWRILSFIFGFPGTLLTFFVVEEGGERAYGVELPKKQ